MVIRIRGHECHTLHVSCMSDLKEDGEEYAGICIWTYNDRTSFTIDGHRMRIGYIIIQKSDGLEQYSGAGQVHGKLFNKCLNIKVGDHILATGFSYNYQQSGEFKFTSRACNHVPVITDPNQTNNIIAAVNNFWNSNGRVQNTSC